MSLSLPFLFLLTAAMLADIAGCNTMTLVVKDGVPRTLRSAPPGHERVASKSNRLRDLPVASIRRT
jgi:predicted small secreted protein